MGHIQYQTPLELTGGARDKQLNLGLLPAGTESPF